MDSYAGPNTHTDTLAAFPTKSMPVQTHTDTLAAFPTKSFQNLKTVPKSSISFQFCAFKGILKRRRDRNTGF